MSTSLVLKRKKKQTIDWFYLLLAEFSIASLGNFAVLAILSLYFLHTLNLPPAQAGGLLFFTSLAFRLPRLLIGPLIDRVPARFAVSGALLLTALGYLGMAFAQHPILVMVLLVTIGIGNGTNSVVVKTLAASSKNADSTSKAAQSPFIRYASLSTGVNLAAAIGSVLGSMLLFHWSASIVFLVAAASYGISSIISFYLPAPEIPTGKRLGWRRSMVQNLKLPAMQRALLFAFLGWFLYTQSYATLPLFVSEGVHRSDLLGSVFALNAILVVVGQLPVSRLVTSLRIPSSQLVLLAFLPFALGFTILWLVPQLPTIYIAVFLWTLGEMLLMPALDTLVAEGALMEYKQTGFALNSLAVSLGEGIGNFIGVAIAGFLLQSGHLSTLYTFLACFTLGAMLLTVFTSSQRESIPHRLLRGQTFVPTGQTQLLTTSALPYAENSKTQQLLAWLSAPTMHEERLFLEEHPEIVSLETGELRALVQQHEDAGPTSSIYTHLKILQDIRKHLRQATQDAYINIYGGLVLDLPVWLTEIKQQLADQSEQLEITACTRAILLQQAISRAEISPALAPEVLAELQMLYAIACLEIPEPQPEVIEDALRSCQQAGQIYTLDRYPYQHARTQVFLSLAYQKRLQGSHSANLEQAVACYQAALAGYKEKPSTMPLTIASPSPNHTNANMVIEEKQNTLQEAILRCQELLYQQMQEESLSEAANRIIAPVPTGSNAAPLSEAWDPDKTIIRPRPIGAHKNMQEISHIDCIARQTSHLSL